MKMKSFAMLAMSGLLAASFAYVAPAMADDMNNASGQSMQSPSSDDSNSTTNTTGTSQGDNTGTNNIGSTDEGSPDTATGDDDY